jgi:malonyl CoA-acyl carrier protein transacylase
MRAGGAACAGARAAVEGLAAACRAGKKWRENFPPLHPRAGPHLDPELHDELLWPGVVLIQDTQDLKQPRAQDGRAAAGRRRERLKQRRHEAAGRHRDRQF